MSDRLEKALRTTPPATVAALPDDVQDRLAEQLRAARRQLRADGAAATEHALKAVPLPLRGLVRKAVS